MQSDPPTSAFQDEAVLRWCFLEDESEVCAAVSRRMELAYINAAGRALVPEDWFGKRCFEMLPVEDEQCAWRCPTIQAVNDAVDITYCEETICTVGGISRTLGVAVIPYHSTGDDGVAAVLLMQPKHKSADEAGFQQQLLKHAERLRERIVARLH